MNYYLKMTFLVVIVAVSICFNQIQAQLIFSQIYEGASYNKCIEISNIGADEYSFSTHSVTVGLWSNKENTTENPTSKYVLNTGSLLPGSSLVICHGSATLPDYAISNAMISSVCNFNGIGAGAADADILVMYGGDDISSVMDVFKPLNYENSSWVRKSEVVLASSVFQESEWLQVTNTEVDNAASSTSIYLGYHLSVAASQSNLNITGQIDDYDVVEYGAISASQQIEVNGKNLIADLQIAASAHFQVSIDDINFSSSLNLVPFEGQLSATIYVVFQPESAVGAEVNGSVHFTSGDVSQEILVSGAEGDPGCVPLSIINENFEEEIDYNDWNIQSLLGNRGWTVKSFGGNSYMQMSGYESDVTVNKEFESFLITPKIDFDRYEQEQLSFKTKNGYYTGTTLSIWLSTDFNGTDVRKATWSPLSAIIDQAQNTNGYSEQYTVSGHIDLASYTGIGYIAFKYQGNNTTLTSTYQVDDVLVTGFNKIFSGALVSNVIDNQLSFNYTKVGEESGVKVYTLSFSDVTGSVSVSSGSEIQLSVDGENWSNTLLVNTEGEGFADIQAKYVPAKAYYFGKSYSIDHRVEGAEPYQLNVVVGDAGIPQVASALSNEATFDLVTWNLEWFGDPTKSGHASSFENQLVEVSGKMIELDGDIYALQEVVVDELRGDFLTPLVDELNKLAEEKKYIGVLGPRFSYDFNAPSVDYPAQRVCFIYNSKSVSNINSYSMFSDEYKGTATASIEGYTGIASQFWASGRLPFLMEAIVSINGKSEQINLINIHAKCCYDSYDRRLSDASYLYHDLLQNYKNDNLVILGDYNDEYADVSSGYFTPYSSWYSNDNNDFLHAAGEGIDHISISDELYFEYYSLSGNAQTSAVSISDHDPLLIRLLLSNDQAGQTILFNQIEDQEVDAVIKLSAIASSNLLVKYKLVSGPAVINDDILTLTGGGTITVQAFQEGNDVYAPAFSDLMIFKAKKAKQVITFNAVEDNLIPGNAIELIASSTSGLPVSFEVVAGNASIDGNVLTLTNEGEVSVKAIQAGDEVYEAAEEVMQTLLVEDKNGVEDEFARKVLIYPNPVNDVVVITLPDENPKTIEVVNMAGATLKRFKAVSSLQFSVSDMPGGLYLIKIVTGEITVAKKLKVVH